MDKPSATIEQITEITDQLINLMDTHMFSQNDVSYLAGVLSKIHKMCLEALAEAEK
jgi:hypothetical protein